MKYSNIANATLNVYTPHVNLSFIQVLSVMEACLVAFMGLKEWDSINVFLWILFWVLRNTRFPHCLSGWLLVLSIKQIAYKV